MSVKLRYFEGAIPGRPLKRKSSDKDHDERAKKYEKNRPELSEWVSLMPFVGAVSLIVYVSVQAFKGKPPEKKTPVNLKVMKETGKVVNMVDIEDLGDKVSYCRCWRSKKFPLCDGSHNKHNEETGDNVGPLVLKRREATS